MALSLIWRWRGVLEGEPPGAAVFHLGQNSRQMVFPVSVLTKISML